MLWKKSLQNFEHRITIELSNSTSRYTEIICYYKEGTLFHAITGMDLKNIMQSNRSQTRKIRIAWILLYEMSRNRKNHRNISRWVVTSGWDCEKPEVTANRYGSSSGVHGNVLELVVMTAQHWNILKLTKLYTLEWWILLCDYFSNKTWK